MSRARTLAGAIGSDGALNVADVAGLSAVASSGSASDLTTGTLPVARIADGAIVNAKLGSDIDASKLTAGSLPSARIASASITVDKIDAWQLLRFRGAYTQENSTNSTTSGIDNLWGGGNAGIWAIARSGYSSGVLLFDTSSSVGTIQWAFNYADASYRRNRTDNAVWSAWRQVD